MAAHRRHRTTEALRHLLGGKIFDIAQQQRGPLLDRQQPQTVLEILLLLAPKQLALRIPLGGHLQRIDQSVNLGKIHPAVTPEKVDRRVVRNARQPLGRFLCILQLVAALQRLDKGLLR